MLMAIASGAFAAEGAGAASADTGKASAIAAADPAPALFTPVAPAALKAGKAVKHGAQVVRFRAVGIERGLLIQAAAAPKVFGESTTAAPVVGRSVTLNLFDDVAFVADADQVERSARGMTWIGHLRGVELSQVVLIINAGVVAGNISMPAARYHIRYAGSGIHEVQEIDQSKFPADETHVPRAPSSLAPR